jgi:hypothetical protein
MVLVVLAVWILVLKDHPYPCGKMPMRSSMYHKSILESGYDRHTFERFATDSLKNGCLDSDEDMRG